MKSTVNDTKITATDIPALTDTNTTKQRKNHVRLTAEQKSEILVMLDTGAKQSEVAKHFGVSSVSISNVKRGYKTLNPRGTKTKAPTPVTDHTVIKTFVG